MFYRDDPQDPPSKLRKPWQSAKQRKLLFSLLTKPGNSGSSPLLARMFWGVILTGPLLICAIIFLISMTSIYNTQMAVRLPTDELTLYIGEMFTVGAIILASVVVGLLGVFRMKLRGILYGVGVVLFVLLLVASISFTSSIATIYTIQPHLEVRQTGFSPAQMSIFTDDKLQVSNASNTVAQTLYVSSSTNTQGIPAQLLRPGLMLQPGQSVNISFSNGGTFILSSSTTPGLTLTITVTETSSGGFDDFSQ